MVADAVSILPEGTTPEATSQGETATWTPNQTGEFEIYATWTAHANRATDAKYMINHVSGSDTLNINQKQNGGQWQLLGTFTLNASSQITLNSAANGYVIADGIRLVEITPTITTSGIYFVHPDHLGTPQVITDENQAIVWQANYDPFGKATIITESITNNIRFPGQYYDQETGLHYNWNRYYDPSTGRYITSDPIGLAGGLNTYGYVYQNPLRYIDPLGLEVDDWRGWGFPSADEHYNRNRNNHCPPKEPKSCGWWNQDQGGLLSNKWRAPTGWECAYDSEGDLLPDTVLDGIQNYSHNYGAGTNPWNPKHIWQDVIPHYWYDKSDGKYPDGLTNDSTTGPSSCDYCAE